MGRSLALSWVTIGYLASSSFGAIVVTVPANTNLLPNTPNQMVPISVTAELGDRITAFSLNAAINHGAGPSPVFQPPSGPITPGNPGPGSGADFVTGTIWTASGSPFTVSTSPATGIPLPTPGFQNLGQIGVDLGPSNSITPAGLIVTLKVDTSGLNTGVFPLQLGGTLLSNGAAFPTSQFYFVSNQVSATFTSGTLTIVPEPAGARLLGMLALVGLVAMSSAHGMEGWKKLASARVAS